MLSTVDVFSEKIKKSDVEDWFLSHESDREYNLYCSIDVRYSGYKVAPVDVNLFPAGFNNLSDADLCYAASVLKTYYRDKKFLILPENHSRNLHYNDNLQSLKKLITLSGNEVVIGSVSDDQLVTTAGTNVLTSVIKKCDGLLQAEGGYTPDIILLNNDLIAGVPDLLKGVQQSVLPSINLGWFCRLKSSFFDIYNDIAKKFCRDVGIDYWFLSTFVSHCNGTNFHKSEGLECIAVEVDRMLSKIRAKYNEYGVQSLPHVFLKADNGSYGMGVTTLFSGQDVFNFNKKARKKMNVTKGKSVVNKVFLQEGVPTVNCFDGAVAEPMIYCVMDKPVAFLYRYNKNGSNMNNLNKVGAEFARFSKSDNGQLNNLLYFVSRLTLLATSIELESRNES